MTGFQKAVVVSVSLLVIVAALLMGIKISIGPPPVKAACNPRSNNPHCHSATPTPSPTLTATPSPTATPSISPSPTSAPGWTTVVDDEFNAGGVPTHWGLYNGPYGSNAHNCAAPSQDTVSGGYLHLTMSFISSGNCGAAWYTGGMRLNGFSSIDQRVTLRWRVVLNGVDFHYVIPMRWPDVDSSWPAGGEEDYCEGDVYTNCSTFLHYSSSNLQVSHNYPSVDLTQWHTMSFARLNHTVTATIDGSVAWTYSGSSTTLPDTLKHVVLQQECHATGCPSGSSGSAEIQVDWITVENPTGTATPTPSSTPTPTPTATPTGTPASTATPSPTPSPSSTSTPTATPSGTSVTVVAVGDIHGEGSDADSVATRNAVDAINPTAVLGLGDYQYTTGSCSNFTTSGHYNSDWGSEQFRMYPTLGPTHDYDASAAQAAQYFSGQCSGQSVKAPGAALAPGGTLDWNEPYSFNLGSWHIIQLPSLCYRYSGCDAAAISTWLTNDLAADNHPCELAYWHEPYWTSPSAEHTSDTSLQAWTQILYNAGADLILNGHQHFYERFFPQNMSNQRDDARGIASIIVGTGGIGFYTKTSTAANEAAYQSGTFGVLRLTLSPTGYATQFVPVEGGTYADTSSGTCH